MQRVRVRVAHLRTPYLNVVITVVMKVKNPVDFGVAPNSKVFDVFDALRNRLSCVFLHLDVVELPVIKEKRLLLDNMIISSIFMNTTDT